MGEYIDQLNELNMKTGPIENIILNVGENEVQRLMLERLKFGD